MKDLWKKPAVKISATAVIVVALALLGLWLWSLRPPPEISFDFLDGRDITFGSMESWSSLPSGSHYSNVWKGCTLAADFNDICETAGAELKARGFEQAPFAPQNPRPRHYVRRGAFGESVSVYIWDGTVSLTYSTPDSSFYASPNREEHDYLNGRVNVMIVRGRLRLWPPQHFLYLLLRKSPPRAKIPQPPFGGSEAKK